MKNNTSFVSKRDSDVSLALGQLALGLELGSVLKEICPACGGGSTREKSLSLGMSEEGYLWWKCHRASCGLVGKRLAWGVVQSKAPVNRLSKSFLGALEMISEVQASLLWETYGLKVPEDWRFAPDFAKLYIPIIGHKGQKRGAILKNLPGGDRMPKSFTFKEVLDEPWMHWSVGHYGLDAHVIVEDMLSAQKLQQSGVPSICILGTHLGMDKIREMLTYMDSAIIALDKDAFPKAVEYAKLYGSLMNLKVWKLERDLKYEPEERIRRAYFERETDFSSGN